VEIPVKKHSVKNRVRILRIINFSCLKKLSDVCFKHFILEIFVKKRNLKESLFVLTIKALSLGYFMLLIFFSVQANA
jgi:hypothetical protein